MIPALVVYVLAPLAIGFITSDVAVAFLWPLALAIAFASSVRDRWVYWRTRHVRAAFLAQVQADIKARNAARRTKEPSDE